MARTDQPHKAAFDDFVSQVTDINNPLNEKHRDLDYGKPETRAAWNGSKSKIPVWCKVHEEFFVQLAANHKSLGQGCPKCGKATTQAKRRSQDPISDFRNVHGDTYDYSRVVYSNTHTPVEVICPAHGSWMVTPLNHLQNKGCPSCWQNRKIAFATQRTADYCDQYAERAARVHKGVYGIIKLPTHSHDDVVLHCAKHGDFTQKAHVHLLGHGCPACGKITSYAQREVADFIASLGVKIEQDNRTVLGGLHIDVWAPNEKVGIEYHGSYWHTQARVGKKHREKWERAEAAGVRLIQMFDFEWLERRSAAENRLRAMFDKSQPVAARKCELREIGAAEGNVFFKQTHTQGAGVKPRATYGLFYEEVLVAAMSFGIGRYSAEQWELLRYSSVGRVAGGFARLLQAFLREHAPQSIMSYCDLRWGNGRVYEANGFVLNGITPPDYWYISKDKRVSRYAAQHRPKGQTEREWAEEHGYEKVLGVGHQRWVWTP